MNSLLENSLAGFSLIAPEICLSVFLILILVSGLLKSSTRVLSVITLAGFVATLFFLFDQGLTIQKLAFNGFLRIDGVSVFLKILMNLGGILTCLLFSRMNKQFGMEYFLLLIATMLGSHLLVMSTNFLVVFLAMELVSISSFILAGFSFTKAGSEGSLKYFLFGAVASAIMLYGFSILYGFSGSVDFADQTFIAALSGTKLKLITVASCMVLIGILYKITASPMHLWAPDVYDAAPISVIAFLSVVPKLAGFGLLLKFYAALNIIQNTSPDWQLILSVVSMLTITIGNFSALKQRSFKRLMAYSSIAHSGFLMIGLVILLPMGIQFMLFYACVYLLMNFLVFVYLQFFEDHKIITIEGFQGLGKAFPFASVCLLIGLISLTGLPPTAGFTAKLLVFSSLWQSYELTGKSVLLILLIFGLLNTVISMFFYLRIPYFAFLKSGEAPETQNNPLTANLFGVILVVLILILFFYPALLMGWINKINFVF